MTTEKKKTRPTSLVAHHPVGTAEGEAIAEALVCPEYPYLVTYSPKWNGYQFTAGTVVCQHGRHRTPEGASRCAAAHVSVLKKKLPHYSVRVSTAPSVMWKSSDGRRLPRRSPAGE